MHLKEYVDTSYPELTNGAKERMGDLEVQWKTLKGQKEELIKIEFGQFNALYKQLGLPALIMDH